MDTAFFRAINKGMENPLFDWLMPFVTEFRNWIPILILCIVYLIRKDPKRGALMILVAVAAVSLSDLINHRVLKELFGRIRPCNALPDVHLLVGCGKSLSFPSSHAVNSFTVAVTLGLYERRLLWVSIPAAALVAFSRVYVGVHYPLDVVAGSFIGAVFGYATWLFSKVYVASVGNEVGDTDKTPAED